MNPWKTASLLCPGEISQGKIIVVGFPSPGNLPLPGIEPVSSVSTALGDRFFTTEPTGKSTTTVTLNK